MNKRRKAYGDMPASFIRKLDETQALVRAAYGAGAFAKYAEWSGRKLIKTTSDRLGRVTYYFEDGFITEG